MQDSLASPAILQSTHTVYCSLRSMRIELVFSFSHGLKQKNKRLNHCANVSCCVLFVKFVRCRRFYACCFFFFSARSRRHMCICIMRVGVLHITINNRQNRTNRAQNALPPYLCWICCICFVCHTAVHAPPLTIITRGLRKTLMYMCI